MRLALAGNPNSGKTTLFNALTGSRAHVGNWPGVTVEKREGVYKKLGQPVSVVDLPGIYSLSPYTPEEVVSRRFLLEEKPDVIVNVVDATNLERNLYLTTQLLEIGRPLLIALNMIDVVEKRGDTIDVALLSEKLGVPVVAVSALRGEGIRPLMEKACELSGTERRGVTVLESSAVATEIATLTALLGEEEDAVFRAVKLFEGDEVERGRSEELAEKAAQLGKGLPAAEAFGGDLEGVVADARYRYIAERLMPCVSLSRSREKLSRSDRADRVLTNRWAGIPIFLFIMFAVFHLTFSENFLFLSIYGIEPVPSPGVFLQTQLGNLTSLAIGGVEGALAGAPAWVSGLLVDGLLAGLDAVLSFLPQILLLFLFLTILENSGYMARVAFLVDRAFRRFGLSGKAFLPLLMCFGCAVPGIMATRTLENEKERHMSVLLAPFFSCGAKMPIWATFAAVLFAGSFGGDLVVFGMYLLGIAVAIVAAVVLRKTALRGETPPFIMELPAYHWPQLKATLLVLWEKLKRFLIRAATMIAGATVVIWFLANFDWSFQMVEANSKASIIGSIGSLLRPLFVPLGFASGDDGWKFVVAILTGLIAKEMVVATMGVLSGGADDVLDAETGALAGLPIAAMISGISVPAAFSFMAFNLLSVPCMAAVAAAHGELHDKKKTWRAVGFWLLTAYLVSFLIYGFGSLFTLGGGKVGALEIAVIVLASALVAFTVVYNVVRRIRLKKRGGGCTGDCGCCSGCSAAAGKKESEKASADVGEK